MAEGSHLPSDPPETPQICCLLTVEELAAVDAIAQSYGLSREEWLTQLAKTAIKDFRDSALQLLATRLSALERDVQQLKQVERQVIELKQQVSTLRKFSADHLPEAASNDRSDVSLSPPTEEDDIEDEPDEILYDFL